MNITEFKKQFDDCMFTVIKKSEQTKTESYWNPIAVYEINNERYLFRKSQGYLFPFVCIKISPENHRKQEVLINSSSVDFLIKAAIIKFGVVKKHYTDLEHELLVKKYDKNDFIKENENIRGLILEN